MINLTYHWIGSKMRAIRESIGIHERQAADYMDVSIEELDDWEKGKKMITVTILDKASKLYGCDVTQFLTFSSSAQQPEKKFNFQADIDTSKVY